MSQIPEWIEDSNPKKDSAQFIADQSDKTVDQIQENKIEWDPEEGHFEQQSPEEYSLVSKFINKGQDIASSIFDKTEFFVEDYPESLLKFLFCYILCWIVVLFSGF